LQINHLDADNSQQQKLVEKSSLYIDEVIKKMREISNDLLPSILVRRGLAVAAEDFLQKVGTGTNTIIETDIKLDDRLPIETEVNLYRIIQEITHNTLKHAKAKKFRVEISQKGNVVRLATADNGVGFTEDVKLKKETGLGLLNLQSRTEVMGGDIFRESAPGQGTKYIFEIPVQKS
jgi:signal transduction histidine kinase